MNICFITSGELDNFATRTFNCDVLVISSGILDKINLVKEASAKSFQIEKLCLLSKNNDCVVIAACDTTICSKLFKSAVIIDCGSLLGIVDMVHILDETIYSVGANFRVFDTSKGKLGIIIGEDIFFTEVARILSLCDSDVLFNLFGKIYSQLPLTMIKAQSFANGTAICMSAEKYIQIADIKGELVFASRASVCNFELEVVKDYHQLQQRKRLYTGF